MSAALLEHTLDNEYLDRELKPRLKTYMKRLLKSYLVKQ
jgi:hypothetical protein